MEGFETAPPSGWVKVSASDAKRRPDCPIRRPARYRTCTR